MIAHLARWKHTFRQRGTWNLVLYTTMLRAAAKSISLTSLGEVVEWRLSDSETKGTSLSNLRDEIFEEIIEVMGRAFVVQVL